VPQCGALLSAPEFWVTRYLFVVPRPLFAAALVVRSRYLIVGRGEMFGDMLKVMTRIASPGSTRRWCALPLYRAVGP
jgi:hypothetical protein